jgi:hypothetical protein
MRIQTSLGLSARGVQRKEVMKSMEYQKPEFTVLAPAMEVVQGSSNKMPTHTDATNVASPSAYEADE